MVATKNNGQRVASGKEKKSLAKVYEECAAKESAARRYDEFPEDITGELQDLAVEYLAINSDMTRLEQRKEKIRDKVKSVMETTGENLLVGDFFVTEMVLSSRPKKIDSRLLLAEGVDMDVIERCTVGGDQYRYLQVRAREDS